MPAIAEPPKTAGQSKVENGKTYVLNEHHRWALQDKPEADQQKPSAADNPSVHVRQATAEKALGTVDKRIGGLIKAFHADPAYKASGLAHAKNVADTHAETAYSWMVANVGKSSGGGQVVDLGQGRMGFSSAAGAIVLQKPVNGKKWQASYTVQTKPVADAAGLEHQSAAKPTTVKAVDPSSPRPASAPTAIPIAKPVAVQAPSPSPVNAAVTQSAKALAPTKHPYQMTRAEFSASGNKAGHKQHLKAAQAAGLAIPDHVLADYPELTGDHRKPEEPKPLIDPPAVNTDAKQPKPPEQDGVPALSPKGNPLADRSGSPATVEPPPHSPAVMAAINAAMKAIQERAPKPKAIPDHHWDSVRQAIGKANPDQREKLNQLASQMTAWDRHAKFTAAGVQGPARPDVRGSLRDIMAKPKSVRTHGPDIMKAHLGGYLLGSGINPSDVNQAALHHAIDNGRIRNGHQLLSVLTNAKRRHAMGDLNASDHEHLKTAIDRQANANSRISPKAAIAEYANENGIPEQELHDALDYVHGSKAEEAERRRTALNALIEHSGVTPARFSKISNASKDHSTVPGFDEAARSWASEYPEYAGGQGYGGGENADDTDYAAKAWAMLGEGRQPILAKHHPKMLDEAAEVYRNGMQFADAGQDNEAVPFSRVDEAIKYVAQRFARYKPSQGQKSLLGGDTVHKQGSMDFEHQHPRDKSGEFTIKGSEEGGFELSNRPAKIIPGRFDDSESTKQKKLLDGMDALPGQKDLFEEGTEETAKPRVTKTPAFKQWFGDSKVVDDKGEPLVVYHGTNQEFAEFSNEKIKSRFPYSFGFHFTSQPNEASVYADSVINASAKWNPDSKFSVLPEVGGRIMPVYLSVKNPLVIDGTFKNQAASMEADSNRAEIIHKLVAAKKAGSPYDGVIIRRKAGDEFDGLNVIVFDPNQIKSAIGNKGTFDPHDSRITYAANRDLRDSIAQAADDTHRTPTAAQIEDGNYSKGKFKIHGLTVSIENPKGSMRRGVDKSGRAWECKLPCHYGYFNRTESKADGDHVDVFVGPDPEAEIAFVVDQDKPGGLGVFDEHKCLVGYGTQAEAKAAYLAAYNGDFGKKIFRAITPMTIPAFKEWLECGDTSRPVSSGSRLDRAMKYAARRLCKA